MIHQVTVIAVNPQGNVLLIERTSDPEIGFWGLPQGQTQSYESTRAAAVRVLSEEAGVVVERQSLVFLGSYNRQDREGNGTATNAYIATVPRGTKAQPADKNAGALWVSQDRVEQNVLAFDHGHIVNAAYEVLRMMGRVS